LKLPTVQDIQNYFLQLPVVTGSIDWMKNHSLPGFYKIPIWDVVVFLYHETKRHDLFMRANSTAFSFFLSLFPTIIALFTLFPIINLTILQFIPETENFNEILMQEIQNVMPGNAGESLYRFVEDITTNPRTGLLSFGFLLALFFSSNGMLTLMQGFEKSYTRTFKQRSNLKKRFIALGLTLLLGMLLFFSVVLIILGNLIIGWVADYIQLDKVTEISISVLRWVVILAVFYSGITIIYRYGAAFHRRIRIFSPGATVATILSILSSVVFSFYVDNFGTYNKLYGSIGTIIVLMLWIEINALVLLIGFELNASIAINRDLKKEIPESVNDVISEEQVEQLEN